MGIFAFCATSAGAPAAPDAAHALLRARDFCAHTTIAIGGASARVDDRSAAPAAGTGSALYAPPTHALTSSASVDVAPTKRLPQA